MNIFLQGNRFNSRNYRQATRPRSYLSAPVYPRLMFLNWFLAEERDRCYGFRTNRTFPVHALPRFQISIRFSRDYGSRCLNQPKRYLYPLQTRFLSINPGMELLLPIPRRSVLAKRNEKNEEKIETERGKQR